MFCIYHVCFVLTVCMCAHTQKHKHTRTHTHTHRQIGLVGPAFVRCNLLLYLALQATAQIEPLSSLGLHWRKKNEKQIQGEKEREREKER